MEAYITNTSPCSGNLGGPQPTPFLFCKFYILRQMLETCASMTFPGFQRLMEWCQSYFTKMSLKACRRGTGVLQYPWFRICRKFETPFYPTFPDVHNIWSTFPP